MQSGELPQAGSKKVGGKQGVVEESKGMEANRSGKRKCQDDDEGCHDKVLHPTQGTLTAYSVEINGLPMPSEG